MSLSYKFYWPSKDIPQKIYDEKYILIHVDNEITFVTMPLKYHGMIFSRYQSLVDETINESNVKGGGIVTINSEKRTLKTYGRSGGFGKPDLDVLTNCLENTVGNEYELTIEITNYVRG